ncbi:MAG TPA: electron transfer flavoprotein subunit alpha/FixB family protein [Candidatus Dormibacteraeota bacterium]|nr:electron transfer flavoprotein subunit alpha/FixB family protein [Candidatus Dormibacteraeota bacterium]
MNVLVFAEHQHNKFSKAVLGAVRAGLQLAQQSGGTCSAAVLGTGIAGLAKELAEYGVKTVYAVEHPALEHYVADAYAQAIANLAKDKGCDVVVATASTVGKDLLPRVAVRLDAGIACDVTGIHADGTFERPMYAGNAIATVSIDTPRKVVTTRTTAFDAPAKGGAGTVEAVQASIDTAALRMKFVGFNETKSDRPVLSEARIVVSGGRGLKNGENFTTVLEPLVDAMGAAMGASRAAVDAGFVPNDLQVGQTGKVVAPELYVAVGISGAIQHLAGMKDSKVIVAINKDEEAPIFQVADYGLVADLFTAVPEMKTEVEKLKH